MEILENILQWIVKILGTALGIYLCVSIPKWAKQFELWLQSKVGVAKTEELKSTICDLCTAAEQELKKVDPDGSKRKAFVIAQLAKLNINVDEQVETLIESCVYSLPHTTEAEK